MAYLFRFLAILLQVYWLLIFVRVLMSWITVDRYNRIVDFIYTVTDFVLEPIRRIIPQAGMFDFSPIVALLLLSFIQQLLNTLAARF